MKQVMIWMMVLLFVSACADADHMTQYYQLEQARTDALIASMESQNVELSKSRTLAMTSYTTAISRASVTPSPSDDVAIALAWGYYMGAPQQVKVPNLQPVKAPPTNVEYIRAWSPIIGMAIPLLWGAVWNAGSSSGTTISAAEGSNVILDSGNPGSYNSVGGDYGMDLIQTDYSLVNQNNDNCATGECDENGGIILPKGGDCSLGGVIDPATGKAYTDSSYTCSCSSFEAGECT